VEAAEATLFQGRPWLICGETRDDGVNAMFEWAERVGAVPSLLTAEEHDRVIAAASHLPQMVSTALAAALAARADAAHVASSAGPGLSDMVRLALSGADIWQDIVATNRDEILRCLEQMTGGLEEVRRAVESGEIKGVFEAGAGLASQVRGR
jgi:prephenate dehydrogenase